MTGPSWDPTLYAGSARHYATGRIGYPVELAEAFAHDSDSTAPNGCSTSAADPVR